MVGNEERTIAVLIFAVTAGKHTLGAFQFYADIGAGEGASHGDDIAILQVHIADHAADNRIVLHRDLTLHVQCATIPDAGAIGVGGVARDGTTVDGHHRIAHGIGQSARTCSTRIVREGAVRQGGSTRALSSH